MRTEDEFGLRGILRGVTSQWAGIGRVVNFVETAVAATERRAR